MKNKWNEITKKLGKRNTYVAISITVVFIVVACFVAIGSQSKASALELTKKEFTYEYGEKVQLDAKDFLKAKDSNILKEIKVQTKSKKVSCDLEKKEDQAKMECLGTYELTLTYKDEKTSAVLEVKDTKGPEFINLNKNIMIEQNAEGVDYAKYFGAKDLTKVKLSVDTKNVKLDTLGTYEAKVTAEDASKNKTTQNIKITVVSKEQASEVTTYTDGTKPVSAATKAEEQAKAEKQAEEEAQAIAEQEQKNQQNQNNGSNISSNTNNNTIGNNTNSGGSSNNGGNNTPTPPPATCTFSSWQMVSSSGFASYDWNEANNYGEANVPIEHGYKVYSTKDNCGKAGWTVGWFKIEW